MPFLTTIYQEQFKIAILDNYVSVAMFKGLSWPLDVSSNVKLPFLTTVDVSGNEKLPLLDH